MTDAVSPFEQALLALDAAPLEAVFRQAAERQDRLMVLDSLLVPALERLGLGWERGDVSLAQLYLASRLCEDLMDQVLPDPGPPSGREEVAIGVFRDHHALGKRMVRAVLRGCGIPVLDLGHGLGVETMVERAAEAGVRVLLVSVLMLPSALRVGQLRAQLDPATRLVVGGAPFRLDPRLHVEVGADAMGWNAADAVAIVRRLRGDGP